MILPVKAAAASVVSTLCDPIDGSPPGSAIHGIFQARVLEWGAIAFSYKTSSVTQMQIFVLYILTGYKIFFLKHG